MHFQHHLAYGCVEATYIVKSVEITPVATVGNGHMEDLTDKGRVEQHSAREFNLHEKICTKNAGSVKLEPKHGCPALVHLYQPNLTQKEYIVVNTAIMKVTRKKLMFDASTAKEDIGQSYSE